MIADTDQIHNIQAHEAYSATTPLALSVIVPTRNEAGNVRMLLSGLQNALRETALEVIFVDDSTDETPNVVLESANLFPDMHVRLIHRQPHERTGGLGGAVVAGLKSAQAMYACVMDGDLQHPPELVPVLLKTAQQKNADLVVATRRNEQSKVTGLNFTRDMISRGLDLTGRVFFPSALRNVSDPLTGFFLVRVNSLDLNSLHPKGFKILLEILVRHPRLQKAEVPFNFGQRFAGTSKASAVEAIRYLNLLWTLRFGENSLRFASFAIVGLSGVAVNALILFLAVDILHIFYLVAAGVATVGSTLWNFGLTEFWVYGADNYKQGLGKRLGMFFVMNLLAYALRIPLIYFLTTSLGLYYLVSNLFSLAAVMALRFLLADNIIWAKTGALRPANHPEIRTWSTSMKKIYNYNIHDIVTVVSEGELPELEPFFVESTIEEPTIRVKVGIPRPEKTGETGQYMRFSEIFGHLGFEVGITMKDQIDVVASPALNLSPHVLYTNVVEPLLRWTFVKKGYALVHGATIAFGNKAYMITARTDTGKTTTLLKILAYQRRNSDQAAFISDDMTIVSPDGMALTYPKPLTISYHTLRAVNSDNLNFWEKISLPFQSRIHSRTGRKAAFLISKTHLPAATINTFVQMLVPPPKYFVKKLVPNAKMAHKAELNGMFIIERGSEDSILPIENKEAMQVLLQNCEDAYGFPPYESIKEFLYCHEGYDLHHREQEIIRQALGKLPATIIRSNTMSWWAQIPSFVNNEQVLTDFSRASNVETAPRSLNLSQPRTVSIR